MFKSKKQKEAEAAAKELPQLTPTVEAKTEAPKPKPADIAPEVKQYMDEVVKHFDTYYARMTAPDTFVSVRPETSIQTNLLFGTLGELVAMRKILEKE